MNYVVLGGNHDIWPTEPKAHFGCIRCVEKKGQKFALVRMYAGQTTPDPDQAMKNTLLLNGIVDENDIPSPYSIGEQVLLFRPGTAPKSGEKPPSGLAFQLVKGGMLVGYVFGNQLGSDARFKAKWLDKGEMSMAVLVSDVPSEQLKNAVRYGLLDWYESPTSPATPAAT